MAIEADGLSTVIAMWILTGLVFAFVLLRVYTRIFVTHSYGVDDSVYAVAFLLFLLFTTCITLSAEYGFGQNTVDIKNPDDVVQAMLWEAIGQTFAVVGVSLAKWSLGLFLLRLVTKTWFKVVIWTAMACVMGGSISVAFVWWLQPYNYLWDRRVQGECPTDPIPASAVLNCTTVTVDFVFAALPWLFIWELQLNKQDKIVILVTMSLGVVYVSNSKRPLQWVPSLYSPGNVSSAAACGIKRTAENGNLSNPNYLEASLPFVVWSAIEIAMTMICIGIAVCRPLYKDPLRRVLSRMSDYYSRSSRNRPYATLDGSGQSEPGLRQPQRFYGGKQTGFGDLADAKLPMAQGENMAQCHANDWDGPQIYRQSDEEILLDGAPRNPASTALDRVIRVTEEFRVTVS
ncbi:hypothetical protein F5Y05DRAFT_408186 [Hypoxylon sp. FL0543]|nr:hypothetical protein F5Y05DRAFT_408186 [Hypoxylon sp. FL0543]